MGDTGIHYRNHTDLHHDLCGRLTGIKHRFPLRSSRCASDRFTLRSTAGRGASHGDHLRDDADADLFRSEGPDFQSDRRVNGTQSIGTDAFRLKAPEGQMHFSPAPDHPEIARVTPEAIFEYHLVVFMASRGDHDKCPVRKLQVTPYQIEPAAQGLRPIRVPIITGEFRSIVND